jgi:hypothetical protein
MRFRIAVLFTGMILAGGGNAAAQSANLRLSSSSSPRVNFSNVRALSPTRDRIVTPAPGFQLRSGNAWQTRGIGMLAGRYGNGGAAIVPLPEQMTTLFASQSLFPMASFGNGHVSFAGFTASLHMGNVMLGPAGAGGLTDFRPWRHYQMDDPRGMDSYGLSLKFHFGHGADIARSSSFLRNAVQFLSEIR